MLLKKKKMSNFISDDKEISSDDIFKEDSNAENSNDKNSGEES